MRPSFPDLLDLIPAQGVGLDELASLANVAIERGGIVVEDGRAAAGIDGRTIRFYQTLGIVPKPSYEGRRAIYDREHLIRVIAAKQLQSEGHSLAEIQSALATRSADELAGLLLSLDLGAGSDARASSAAFRAEPIRAASAPFGAAAASDAPEPSSDSNAPSNDAAAAAPSPIASFQIAPGVLVLIDPRHVADPTRIAQQLAEALARGAACAQTPPAAPMTKPHGGKDRGDEDVEGGAPRHDRDASRPAQQHELGGNR